MTSTTPAAPDVRARADALVEAGLRACEAYGRADLAGRLTAAREALADPVIHIVVMGEFKQGKSSLVNALVAAEVCPVDDDIATAVPTYVRHGDPPRADLIYDGDPPEREQIALDEIRRWVVAGEQTAPRQARRVVGMEVRLPRRLLGGGLVLVDTPGVGGLGSTHAAASLTAASMADALLFVTDAAQEVTASEQDFLRQARQMCPTVACVLTKTDYYPQWRQIRELDTGHLGDQVPVLPVSSLLRSQAADANDPELNEESGFPELVRFVRERVGGGAERRLAGEAAATVAAVCDQIRAQFQAERSTLADPARARQVVDELTAVKERVETLRSAASQWSTTLTDGIGDLNADVDHDLRERIRAIITEADASIEQSDPADTWDELQRWLEARVAHDMLANYTLLRDRATALSELVGGHFQEASGEVLTRLAVANPTPLATSIQTDDRPDLTRMSVGKQAMVALKATYSGALMFVMLGFIFGVSLTPLAVGIGLIMGRKGLKDEKKKQMQARQAQARNAVRRYCDEVSFVMGKDSKDTLRRIQRQLRDHYTALAEELNRSTNEALRAATAASQRSQAERQQRLQDLDAELDRLGQLRAAAAQLATTDQAPQGAQ